MKDYIINTRGHKWIIGEYYGEVDIFAFDHDIHNGPMCSKCGYSFCHHCNEGPLKDCPSN